MLTSLSALPPALRRLLAMNRRCRSCRLHLLAVLVCIWIPATPCRAQQPPLLEQLTQTFNGYLEALELSLEPHIMVEDAVGAAVAVEDPGQKQALAAISQRNQRHLRAVAIWLATTGSFSTQQHQKVLELADQLAQQAPDPAQAGRGHNQQQNSPAPVLYAGPGGPGRKLSRKFITSVLETIADTAQQEILRAALQERDVFHRRAFAAYIAELAGRRLYLTSTQCEQLTALIDQRLVELGEKSQHPLYAANPQAYFLPYESLWTCISDQARKQVLNEAQSAFLKESQNLGDSLDQMHLSSSQSPEEWLQFVTDSSQKLQPWMLTGYLNRAQFYQDSLQLTDEQTAQLKLAALGATSHSLREWRDQCYNTIDQMENHRQQFAGGNFSFGLSRPDFNGEQSNPSTIWQNAVEKLQITQQATDLKKQRVQRRKQSDAHCALALLDQEFWLQPDQREAVQQLTAQVLPKQEPWEHYEYFRDIMLICYPLLLAEEEPIKKVLNDEQFEAWQGTAKMFQFDESNRLVQLNLQNQGQWSFQLNQ